MGCRRVVWDRSWSSDPPPLSAPASRQQGQVAGDARGPSLDLGPVAEVALGKQGPASWQGPDRPVTEAELARVQRAEEHSVLPGVDGLLQLGGLLGLCGLPQVPPLGVCGLHAERPAAEQPHRPADEDGLIPSHKLHGLLQPVPEIGSASDHEGVVAGHVSCFANWPGLGVLDRKSTRLKSRHITNSYAVFCLKKKKKTNKTQKQKKKKKNKTIKTKKKTH